MQATFSTLSKIKVTEHATYALIAVLERNGNESYRHIEQTNDDLRSILYETVFWNREDAYKFFAERTAGK